MQKKSKKGVGQNKNFGKLTFCEQWMLQPVCSYACCKFLGWVANTSWDQTLWL